MKTKKIVPSTKLRAFYEFLTSLSLSTETQKSIMKDLLRKENHKKLVKLFDESYHYVESTYENTNEPFFNSNSKRKPIIYKPSLVTTNDVNFHFENLNKVGLTPTMYDFSYIERGESTSNYKRYIS